MCVGHHIANTVGIQHQVTIGVDGLNGIVGNLYVGVYRTSGPNLVKVGVDFGKGRIETFSWWSGINYLLSTRSPGGSHAASGRGQGKHSTTWQAGQGYCAGRITIDYGSDIVGATLGYTTKSGSRKGNRQARKHVADTGNCDSIINGTSGNGSGGISGHAVSDSLFHYLWLNAYPKIVAHSAI